MSTFPCEAHAHTNSRKQTKVVSTERLVVLTRKFHHTSLSRCKPCGSLRCLCIDTEPKYMVYDWKDICLYLYDTVDVSLREKCFATERNTYKYFIKFYTLCKILHHCYVNFFFCNSYFYFTWFYIFPANWVTMINRGRHHNISKLHLSANRCVYPMIIVLIINVVKNQTIYTVGQV